MRYYEVHFPGDNEPGITTNVRGLKNLPEGTKIHAIVTESDGSLADTWEIPVENGKPVIKRKGKDSTSYFPHLNR
jgi:hypothetical protein